ncbi:MAG: DUF1800 domain-containing protein [Xanthomonadales bacterium]|uniref:DUF1800 domain-containing protein n=1 Tax=Dokdonella sp. TaxID=2291710 RepID=UPI002C075744|nr:DUF1800 domain-containing protein [Xanthomonadales bacterium]HQV73246.1 DUF1800 family protein [Dokdonella sp.]MBK7013118.1 DUF1800 domain-containing protein [Xanthomonadales bacterium]MBL0221933.1 DUF1800 domain-containing protein [Xanthomonadales bacterium]HQW76572.1 DUF1800 family protein [Dokdonella sp.]
MNRIACCLFACCALLLPLHAVALTHDPLFDNSFESPTDLPASDAEAARFLTQASYGPTPAEITRLRAIGYAEWLRQEFNKPATLVRPHLEAVNAALLGAGQSGVSQNQRLDRWFHTAATGSDQLRQRLAFALSQILVISDQNGSISGEPIQMSEYWDILARNAFGNYRELIDETTWNPSMGKFLSHFRNQKASADGLRQPDENYAREVMQLFSIGLIERNLDFTPILSGGLPIPTYDQNVVSNYAKVFTGFNYNNATTITNGTNTYLRMTCIESAHDATAKVLVGGSPLPAGQTCPDDVADGLDLLFAHPNIAPFISRQLIQRFTTSSPSPAYIQRVAQKFVNNGFGERGDLSAVIRQILLDPDARGTPTANSGKLREPLLKLTALWRAWNAQMPAADAYGNIAMGMTSPTGTYGQRPLGADTVFNFFEPDYQQPGAIANAGLFSPEFQTLNESTIVSTANSLYTYGYNSYVGMSNPPSNRPLLDISPLTALGSDHAAMVEEANRRMLYGTMSSGMRTSLINALTFMDANVSVSERARSIIYLVAISPEYAVQR